MLDLKHGESKSWNMKVAKQKLFIKGLKQVRSIVYAGTGASNKDHLRITWAGKQIQYSPHFFQNDSSKQKSFHLSRRELHDKCPTSISVEIIWFEHLHPGSYEKLNPGIFSQKYVQPNALQVAIMMVLWKMIIVFRSSSWNFSFPHDTIYFVRQSLQKHMEKVTSKVLFCEISWENIYFCGLKKKRL